jgi:SAM-dependent methyltransferase
MTSGRADRQTQSEVVEVYNRLAGELLDLQSNWEYMTSKQLTDAALIHDASIDGATVLNVGCSVPLDEIAYAHRVERWVATDLGDETIGIAREAARGRLHPDLFGRLEFAVADGTALPFDDASFDVAISLSTVDHVPDGAGRQRFIDEMARVVRPGGRVVVTVPNRWSRGYANRARRLPPDQAPSFFEYCFSPPEIRGMVRRAGLTIVRFTSTAEMPVLAPRLVLPGLAKRPLLSVYNRVARELGVRMGLLAVKPR